VIPAPRVVVGPSLYRHECRTCGEETLHNYLGCTRCETYPWGKPLKLGGDAQRIMKSGMRQRNW
jgi:hypothetical protein